MKRLSLIAALSTLLVLSVLVVGIGTGIAQEAPLHDPRPTPTPILPLPPYQPPANPESPEIPPLPDLVVVAIQVVPATPLLGEPVTIRVTIHNPSIYDVEPGNNFWTDLYIDPAVVPIQLQQDGEAEWPCQATWVPAGGYHTLEVVYPGFEDVKVYSLWAQVDTDGHVAEANEHNNVFGPVSVQVKAPNTLVHETHQDFQLGLASTLDGSHSEGVLRPGLFVESWQAPGIYEPDARLNTRPAAPPAQGVRQFKPAIATDGQGTVFGVWEDGRHGDVFNRDIFFAVGTHVPTGLSWDPATEVKIGLPDGAADGNQVSPDIAYDRDLGRIYVVWQDERSAPQQDRYDIYFAYSDDGGATWLPSGGRKLNDDAGTADQLNPAVALGRAEGEASNHVYVAWQDRRNGNDDIYLARSDDGGGTWEDNYFVTDDPDMTLQNQTHPAVAVEQYEGRVVVGWEDWRDPAHPEIYTMWSKDQGITFGVDIPVDIVAPEDRTTYRLQPDLAAHTTIEWVERVDPITGMIYWIPQPVAVIHVAWEEVVDGNSEVYYSFAPYDFTRPDPCPVPIDWKPVEYCFDPPQQISGYELPSAYVRPPNGAKAYPREPSWQGEVSLDLVPDDSPVNLWDVTTTCLLESSDVYSKGVMIAWSDAGSYDEWRHEIHVRRVASAEGDPKSYVACERPRDVGMVNSNAKLHIYRDNLENYDEFKPAAARQSNPYIAVDETAVYVAWDDDRWDDPFTPSRDTDAFSARMAPTTEGAYISPVIDGGLVEPQWYVLSWWAATDHSTDVLFQTRFGNNLDPPQTDTAGNGWTPWTGNPSSGYLGCDAGSGCFYDAPGRHIVGPDGNDWFGDNDPGPYRYMQYKVIMSGRSRWTALSQVLIHYKGPSKVYLPVIYRNH